MTLLLKVHINISGKMTVRKHSAGRVFTIQFGGLDLLDVLNNIRPNVRACALLNWNCVTVTVLLLGLELDASVGTGDCVICIAFSGFAILQVGRSDALSVLNMLLF